MQIPTYNENRIMETNNPKVFIIEPKTGLAHELPGVVKIGMPHVDVSDFKPKQNPETGLYSWQAKATCKIKRRDMKKLLHMFRPRVFKYIAKDKMARQILESTKEGAYTYEQLMRMSAKQLKPIFALILCAKMAEYCASLHEHDSKQNYPCGGIVPGGGYKTIGDELVLTKEQTANLAEQLK